MGNPYKAVIEMTDGCHRDEVFFRVSGIIFLLDESGSESRRSNPAALQSRKFAQASRPSQFHYHFFNMIRSHLLLKLNDGIIDRSPEVKLEVTLLQKSLAGWHYLSGEGIDGEFGQKTDEAVRHFQKDHAIGIDGEVGKFTWAALIKCDPSDVEIRARSQTGTGQGVSSNSNKILAAALKLEGMDTSGDGTGGKEACLWAVNKVLRQAGVTAPWGASVYVPDAHAALERAGIPKVGQQQGAIAIFTDNGSPPYPHVGICVNNGQILSNSSSRGSFAWRDTPNGYRSYKHDTGPWDVIYYLL